MKFIPLPVFLFLLFITHLPAQTIRFVDQNAASSGDGSSWSNAFIRLQQALAVAQDGDEIWVAKGIYKPSTTNDRFAYYDLPSGVKVYGGFFGTESQRDQRDWAAHPVILSGDIGVPGDSTDNAYNILYSYSPNEKTCLDGLIFEEGNANNVDNSVGSHRPTRSGGGIYLDGEAFGYAQLSVSNCIFRRNRANYQGGGLYANGRDGGMAIVRLENCLFERNVALVYGGGLALENYFEQPFALEFKSCEFRENFALTGGAAIWLNAHQAVAFTECKFLRNRTTWGQAISFGNVDVNYPVNFKKCYLKDNGDNTIWYIGYLATNDAEFDFEDCTFEENGLPVIYIYFFEAARCRMEVKNCIFSRNSQDANSIAAVVQLRTIEDSSNIVYSNCLFFENEQYEIAASGLSTTYVNNSIFIDNQNLLNKTILNGSGTYFVANSLFRLPSCALIAASNSTVFCDSTNLFAADPLFVNPSLSDFHLQPCSPAINAGMNAILDSLSITTDLDGNPRIRNEVVDMGPYETHISLNPSISGAPACAGANNGAVKLSPDACPPYSFVWSNGVTTGSNTNGLAAGTYIFTVIGSNNIPVSDTIALSEPLPITISTELKDANCYGEPSGQLETFVSGGTPNYQYHWDPPLPPVPAQFNLPSGNYFVTATDANGCTGTSQASIGSPGPIQYFFSTQDASCLGCSDGSIVFDSVLGGTNPPLPAPMFNLAAGSYCLTLTDAAGCAAIPCFTIGATSGVLAEPLNPGLKISPNPTAFGEIVSIELIDSEGVTLRVLDLEGRVLEEKRIAPNTTVQLHAKWPSGIYQVEIQTESGKRAVRRWVIF